VVFLLCSAKAEPPVFRMTGGFAVRLGRRTFYKRVNAFHLKCEQLNALARTQRERQVSENK